MSTPKTTKKKTAKRAAKKGGKTTVSESTLARLPARVAMFLMAIGTIPEVRTRLATRGYNATVHQAGWTLLDVVGGRASLTPTPVLPALDERAEQKNAAVETAQQTIETWASETFAIASAALEHSFPAQHAYVFADDLKAGTGGASVLAAQTFLNRVDRLGSKRRNSTPDDAKAFALLGERGITEAERSRVRALITTVQEGKAPAPTTPPPATPAPAAASEAQLKLYAWYNEWTRIARVVITHRGHLVRLGLASLKRSPKTTATPA